MNTRLITRLQAIQADRLRRMYPAGRGDPQARRYARAWVRIIGSGLLPRRWVVLEVPGRHTGRPTRFPLGMADLDGRWYLVSMLGECNWVKNVRAAGYRATLCRRRARDCRLMEVPADQRAPVLRRYLQKVPGGRPHIPISADASLTAFGAIAVRYPVFRVEAIA
ncbi:nitroreductase/quinone reductase family protein [Mycobacterium sp.]|uniref:nitroreductase/quinone reductase family protein n=1 Tax=Mycobacterium sp. TaxID=1785 RepID=UPI002C976D5B|nr:nitroreductase/quinone reductase family protein [Mycobacterium sp.]HME47848.1 nitroreductase/quinone reductase family protein [Mycobacterium sp.]